MSDNNLQIRHPARYVPLTALATGSPGSDAIPVSLGNPIPCAVQPLGSVRALTPDNAVEPGLAVLVDCSAAGTIMLELSDGSQLPLTYSAGVTLLPFAVRSTVSVGSTATFNAWVLS
ncbi:hypothetical protein GCM10023115_06260 [Pontixanthobacter gangjinensis]|uniref:Uncharacterized protein n=1 Tax=Pontixanthobacter gangjinensis TaxID=1028742 RepID=A0A6I4SJL6_9SPHN|nr:hypothetical protein [Pontixanthobacter gangjinensis]MXO55875.1 hypothetical protein [Pontixanthobacter gangjinensis]